MGNPCKTVVSLFTLAMFVCGGLWAGERLTKVIGPDRATTHREYDKFGRLSKITSPNGAETAFVYNAANQLIRQANALGVVTEFSYDTKGHLVEAIADATGIRASTRYSYNVVGQLIATTNPLGNTTRYEYNPIGNMVKVISPSGHVTKFEYDAIRRRIKTIDPAELVKAIEYASGGNNIAAINRADGNSILWYTYDPLGHQVTADGLDMQKEELIYDAVGQIIERRRGNAAIKMKYDKARRLAATTNAVGGTTRFEYDLSGNLISAIDPTGSITRFEYDNAGRQVKTVLPGGWTRENIFSPAGQLIEIRGGPEGTKKYEYDILGRRTAEINAKGGRRTTQYDTLDRITKVTDELNQSTSYEYNLNGQRTALIDSNGNRTTWEYDADGRQTSMTFPNGDREEYKYDAAGKLIEKKTPNEEFIRYTYDDNTGFLVRIDVVGDVPYVRELYAPIWAEVKNAGINLEPFDFSKRNFSVIFTRDTQGRVLSETCPMTTYSTKYDPNGLIASVHDASLGVDLIYDYNAIGLRTKMIGVAKKIENTFVSVNYDYDMAGRLISTQVDDDFNVTYEYAEGSNRKKMRYSNGAFAVYTPDANGRIRHIRSAWKPEPEIGGLATLSDEDAPTLFERTFSYDPSGMLTGYTTSDGREATYGYDARNRLLSEEIFAPLRDMREKIDYVYDDSGLPSIITANGARREFTHNAAGQISHAIFTNEDGRIKLDFQYDRNGNLVRMRSDRDGQQSQFDRIFVYDALNRLSHVVRFSDGAENKITYRGLRWHIFSTESRFARFGNGKFNKQLYTYDGNRPLLTMASNPREDGFGEKDPIYRPFKLQVDNSVAEPLFYKYFKPIIGTFLGGSGYAYLPYGNGEYFAIGNTQRNSVEQIAAFQRLESGEKRYHIIDFHDIFSERMFGLRYFRNRFSFTDINIWLSRDPAGYLSGDENLYTYMRNNSINNIDPYGLMPVLCTCRPGQKDEKDFINNHINGILRTAATTPATFRQALENSLIAGGRTILTGIETHIEDSIKSKAIDGVGGGWTSASVVVVCGVCIGTDKLGHFFEEGLLYRDVKSGVGEKFALALG